MSGQEPDLNDYKALYHIAVEARSQMREELSKSARSNASFVKENHALRSQLLALRAAAHDVGSFLQWAADHEMENGQAQRLTIGAGTPDARSLTAGAALHALSNALLAGARVSTTDVELETAVAPFKSHTTFAFGQRVEKRSGSQWHGKVVGLYSTDLTPEGYAIESEREQGSVQIYPAKALTPADGGE